MPRSGRRCDYQRQDGGYGKCQQLSVTEERCHCIGYVPAPERLTVG